ncbi:hypothetical protein HYPSUDRAFT_69127 [Hypholoma sublateritium FD-334 SS-4]|uniref:Uncharacterized protein n=1 Tax=Hypholoma sublateritium (strain FD-334 SS-4) TaxID=945553 RepID=A0A0D2M8B8_HYPSF|nr:hypothetical protein HYPSUDRAFT_69127 [Hypholoma sublateritium FD-334 SS-4]
MYGGYPTNSPGTQLTSTHYLQGPYDSSHYNANHATPAHHHGQRHTGHTDSHRYRVFSQAPQQQQQQQQHRNHHHQSRAAPPSSCPTNARQRSYSVDVGDPRMARPHQTGAFSLSSPMQVKRNTGRGTMYDSTFPQQYPNYIQQSYPGAHTPSQSSNYRVIVQPPSTTRSGGQSTARAPTGVPVSDGRGGWVIVPRNGQNVQVWPSQNAHNYSAYGSSDGRGRESSPGFWRSLFGQKRRSNSAAQYEPGPHHGHGYHRPRNIHRRSSR